MDAGHPAGSQSLIATVPHLESTLVVAAETDPALSVRTEGLKSVDVVAAAQPGAPANLALYLERGSSAGAGKRRLVATVTDLYGNSVPNAKLGLSAKGGSVSPSHALTDARGTVALTWTPGSGAALVGVITGTDVSETYALRAGPAFQQAGAPSRDTHRRR